MQVKSLPAVAKELGVTQQTMLRWFHEGRIEGAQRVGNTIIVPIPTRVLSDYSTPLLSSLIPREDWRGTEAERRLRKRQKDGTYTDAHAAS